jgi:two-component system chemotaxis sensor kinase CheA
VAEPTPEPVAEPTPEPVAEPTPEPAPPAKPDPEPVALTPQPAPKPAPQPKKAAAPARKPRVASTIKVNTGRLDSLVDLVGELVIAQQMIYQDPDLENLASERLTRNLAQVAKITRDMHEAAMSLRMVTLKPTFQKMARLVRDVSAKAGKQVDLVLTGEDTELDRNVVEEISDPMVHLIRNAIDHGLETPEVRQASGKSPAGRLELRAFHQGGSIVIEIVDDGAGLSRERILAKAVEKGLIASDVDPDEMPDSTVWDLIFQPGFSTAAVVSDISGRGVGMDVVRRNIEKMRGKVEIVSKAGEGSVFSLRLPLTLAIIDGMIVRVGAQRYVLPTLSIEQSFRPAEEQLHEVMNEGELVKVREMLLPIHRVRDLFDQDDGIVDVRRGILIVLEDNGQRCCLMVDEILGQQQVVIKSLGEAGGRLRGISGGAILGDGRIALIVDVDGVVTRTTQAVA